MRIGLIDVDGHGYPNLALMKLSAWHKSKGDTVEWWWGWNHYDRVYMSKVFSDTYSDDHMTPCNCDEVLKGGSGYALQTVKGLEIYDKDKDRDLPAEIEHCCPDYSLYPELTKNKALGRLTVGCPKKCPWCHVCSMQGTEAYQVADLSEFWSGQKHVNLLDPNLLAAQNREQLLNQLADSRARINFEQGLDIQRCDEDVIKILNRTNVEVYHFAWDDPNVDLTEQFAFVGDRLKVKRKASRMVYVLTNFFQDGGVEWQIDSALERIYILRSLNFDPYVMIYDKPSAPEQLKHLQRWCNNKIIFGSCPDFSEYEA